MAQTKNDLLEELTAQLNKDELVHVVGSKLKKDELAKLLEDEGDASKEELVRKLGSRTKGDLAEALGSHLTKDELQRMLDSRTAESGRGGRDEKEEDSEDGERGRKREPRQEAERDTGIDWSAELAWAPPPRPTPAPVTFAGAAPFQPGQRVRVDVSGLPMLGVFAGKGASAAGTIVGVDARERMVRVYLDAVFDGEKELVVPPERIAPDR
jgi:ribosomal protein L21E